MTSAVRIQSVILDTNILFRDFKLSGYDLRKLIKTKDLYSFDLCIPEVVQDECIGNYIAESKLRSERLVKAINEINELLPNRDRVKSEIIDRKTNDCVKKYKSRLKRFIKDNKINLLSYPEVSHKDIVGKMYEKNQPFNNGSSNSSEKGYKDYLIAESVRSYIKNKNIKERTILVTNNIKDFIEPGSQIEKDKAVPLAKNFDLNSVYVTTSLTVLFDELKQNLKGKSTHSISASAHSLTQGFEKAIASDYWMLEFEIFGINTFDVRTEKITCEIADYSIEINEDADILEMSGIIKISIVCSFEIDDYDAYHLDEKFPFLDQVQERVKSKKLSPKDSWTESFKNIEYKGDFIFNHIDFNYNKNNFPEVIDPTFLTITKI